MEKQSKDVYSMNLHIRHLNTENLWMGTPESNFFSLSPFGIGFKKLQVTPTATHVFRQDLQLQGRGCLAHRTVGVPSTELQAGEISESPAPGKCLILEQASSEQPHSPHCTLSTTSPEGSPSSSQDVLLTFAAQWWCPSVYSADSTPLLSLCLSVCPSISSDQPLVFPQNKQLLFRFPAMPHAAPPHPQNSSVSHFFPTPGKIPKLVPTVSWLPSLRTRVGRGGG